MVQSNTEVAEAPIDNPSSRPDERKIIMDFLDWVSREYGADLCTPGYAGEMNPTGHIDKFVDGFLHSLPEGASDAA